MTLLEVFAVGTGAVSVWLLARNKPSGWVVGLFSVVAFGFLFFQARLFAEVGIQIFYFVTSLQAVYIWLRGGEGGTEKPVSRATPRTLWVSVALVIVGTFAIYRLLLIVNGAAPSWDALTTVLSLTAHIYLMWRFVESWFIWIAVDVIYVPLYASRGLALTSALYVVFLLLSIKGLITFRRELAAQDLIDASS